MGCFLFVRKTLLVKLLLVKLKDSASVRNVPSATRLMRGQLLWRVLD